MVVRMVDRDDSLGSGTQKIFNWVAAPEVNDRRTFSVQMHIRGTKYRLYAPCSFGGQESGINGERSQTEEVRNHGKGARGW